MQSVNRLSNFGMTMAMAPLAAQKRQTRHGRARGGARDPAAIHRRQGWQGGQGRRRWRWRWRWRRWWWWWWESRPWRAVRRRQRTRQVPGTFQGDGFISSHFLPLLSTSSNFVLHLQLPNLRSVPILLHVSLEFVSSNLHLETCFSTTCNLTPRTGWGAARRKAYATLGAGRHSGRAQWLLPPLVGRRRAHAARHASSSSS